MSKPFVRPRQFCAAAVTASMLALGVPLISVASAAPAPTPAAQSVPAELLPAVNSEANLQANTVHLLRLIEHLFPYYKNGGVIGGYRQDAIADHPSGQALDIMMANDGRDPASVRDGNLIAAFLVANANQLGVDYMVWRQHIWHPGQAWRLMSDRGNWTDNHMNHIHVKVFGNHVPTGGLVMPEALKGLANSLPDERILAVQTKIVEATARLVEAEAELRSARKSNSKRNAVLNRAQGKVNGTARQTYMLGMDAELHARSIVLLNAETVDAAALVAAERILRAESDEVDSSLGVVRKSRQRLAQARIDAAQAHKDLTTAKAELQSLLNG